ncbi:MAG: LamG-like jellyroll fold domain-containing protein [Acidimicrobiales bacterium]
MMVRRILAGAGLAAAVALAVPLAGSLPASAAVFNGTSGYFTGDGTTANLLGGTSLTWNGTAQYATDNFSGGPPQSFSLDGSTTLTDADTTVGNLGSGDFAIGVHFKTTQAAGNIELLSKQADCSGAGEWLQVDLANSGVYVQVVGATSSTEFSGALATGPEDGAWHFAELVRSGNTLHLLLDGQQVATRPYSGPNPSNSAPLTIGGGPCATPVPNGAPDQDFQGELSYAYLGAGSDYTLSIPGGTTSIAAGDTNGAGPTLQYHNDIGLVMLTTVSAPGGSTLASLTGPGCNFATSSCTYPLEGNGRPITPGLSVPGSATPGSTLTGGEFRMTDLGLPLNPSSTGWDPTTGRATIPFSVTVAPAAASDLANPALLGGALGAAVVVLGGVVLFRRRRLSRAQ